MKNVSFSRKAHKLLGFVKVNGSDKEYVDIRVSFMKRYTTDGYHDRICPAIRGSGTGQVFLYSKFGNFREGVIFAKLRGSGVSRTLTLVKW